MSRDRRWSPALLLRSQKKPEPLFVPTEAVFETLLAVHAKAVRRGHTVTAKIKLADLQRITRSRLLAEFPAVARSNGVPGEKLIDHISHRSPNAARSHVRSAMAGTTGPVEQFVVKLAAVMPDSPPTSIASAASRIQFRFPSAAWIAPLLF
jgi:hypothetical protein